jgi:hypothetical protein
MKHPCLQNASVKLNTRGRSVESCITSKSYYDEKERINHLLS